MGTKNNPGKYDCYAKADPDEPIFILRANDPSAPLLVRTWCELNGPHTNMAKLMEAYNCADAMEQWRREKHGG